MDLSNLIIIIALFCAIGFLYKYIPAPWNWVVALIGCVLCMLALAGRLGVPIHL